MRELLPRGDAGDVGAAVGRSVAQVISSPSWRAGLIASTITGAVCMRAGMPRLTVFGLMIAAHIGGAELWEMAEDVRAAARKITADAPDPV